MSFNMTELRDLAAHERIVLDQYAKWLGPEDEILVQPPSGGGGSPLSVWRVQGFHLNLSSITTAFVAYPVAAPHAPDPDPLPATSIIWPFAYPPIMTSLADLKYAAPRLPFAGVYDPEIVLCDVLCMWLDDPTISAAPPYYGPGGYFIVQPHFLVGCFTA